MKASVIIPSYNACERLYFNLLSLNYQDCGREDFEVIVIDNGSKDKTSELLKKFKPNFELSIINFNRNKGRAAARNAGINNSHGEILIFHDSDMIASKDFVRRHMEEHEAGNRIVCGASWKRLYSYYYKHFSGYLISNLVEQKHKYNLKDISFGHDKYPLIKESHIADGSFLDYAFELEAKESTLRGLVEEYGEELIGYNFPWRFFITNNCSGRKSDIVKAGLFDESFKTWGCEDLDLGYRLYKLGSKFIKKNDIVSVHQEHPINSKENGISNIHYFTDKYNTIDLLLFYYSEYTSMPQSWINELVNEVKLIEYDPKYKGLLEFYAHMLKALRENHRNVKVNAPSFQGKSFVKSEIFHDMLKDFGRDEKAQTLTFFMPSLYLLIRELYGIESEV